MRAKINGGAVVVGLASLLAGLLASSANSATFYGAVQDPKDQPLSISGQNRPDIASAAIGFDSDQGQANVRIQFFDPLPRDFDGRVLSIIIGTINTAKSLCDPTIKGSILLLTAPTLSYSKAKVTVYGFDGELEVPIVYDESGKGLTVGATITALKGASPNCAAAFILNGSAQEDSTGGFALSSSAQQPATTTAPSAAPASPPATTTPASGSEAARAQVISDALVVFPHVSTVRVTKATAVVTLRKSMTPADAMNVCRTALATRVVKVVRIVYAPSKQLARCSR